MDERISKALVRELQRLVQLCDTEATLPDGSNPDTLGAHKAIEAAECALRERAPHEQWVVHHPYPDGSWRGLEKCTGQGFDSTWRPADGAAVNGATLLFNSEQDAQDFITSHEGLYGAKPVRVLVETPAVRVPLEPKPDDWTRAGTFTAVDMDQRPTGTVVYKLTFQTDKSIETTWIGVGPSTGASAVRLAAGILHASGHPEPAGGWALALVPGLRVIAGDIVEGPFLPDLFLRALRSCVGKRAVMRRTWSHPKGHTQWFAVDTFTPETSP